MKELSILNLNYCSDSTRFAEHFVDDPWTCFLDSCSSSCEHKHHSRYDILTSAPWATVTLHETGDVRVCNQLTGTTKRITDPSPFSTLESLLASMSPVEDSELPFTGGAMGFWSYDLINRLESKRVAGRGLESPVMGVGLYHWALITDHANKTTIVVFHPDMPSDKKEAVRQKLEKLNRIERPNKKPFTLTQPFKNTITREAYRQAFARIQDYIRAGDTYEINLTQEFTSQFEGSCWDAYKHLRTISPAPYSAFIHHPDLKVLSHSPERFVRVANRMVETHPIKGTRPRGTTPKEDKHYIDDLLNSEKDRAENLMVVDLLRNDLGRVCTPGSIKVLRLFALESYANVHHLVSTITGELDDKRSLFSVMESAFPGGSITGAPKIRSMEIIRELEATPRSVYCGCIGYVSCNGTMDTSITIRTIVTEHDRMHCWGGGAIVADSDCDMEYEESITKVKNLMSALETFRC